MKDHPEEINQCDGCKRGLLVKQNFHYTTIPTLKILMACTKNRYTPEVSEWEKKFDALFGDEIIERVQEYCYLEKYPQPLRTAQTFVQNLKVFIRRISSEEGSKKYAIGQSDSYDIVRNQALEEAVEASRSALLKKARITDYADMTEYDKSARISVAAIRTLKK